MNYYVILGIGPGASLAEIKEAYRKLVQKYHPDHFGEDSSPFLRIQEAYQVLSDPVERKKYDKKLARTVSQSRPITSKMTGSYATQPEPLIPTEKKEPPEPLSILHSFETYFPSFDEIFDRLILNFGQSTRQKSEMMENLTVEVTISPEKAKTGGSIKLLILVRINCPLCRGTGFVGFWDCYKCRSNGFIDTEIPLFISYPGGIENTFNKSLPLNKYGIDNFYLTVRIRVSIKSD